MRRTPSFRKPNTGGILFVHKHGGQRVSHFDQIAGAYHQAQDAAAVYYTKIAAALDPFVKGQNVLDVGNGGRFLYDPALPARIVALDVSAAMLEPLHAPNLTTQVGDVRDLTERECYGAVVFGLVLHHVTERNLAQTEQTLVEVLRRGWHALTPGGTLAIVETALPPLLYQVQRAMYVPMRAFLEGKGVGMIAFSTSRRLRTALAQVGATHIEERQIVVEGWFDPLAGSFPGRIKVPQSLSPTRNVLFLATKLA
jgi:hypothetical protein